MVIDPIRVARAQGALNILGGLWPLLSLRSFEKIFGPKTDEWLLYVVSGLLISAGSAQVRAAHSPETLRIARTLGVGTAFTLLAIDLRYVPTGRLRPTYLLDAAAEAAWLLAWSRTKLSPR